ncbi:MAG TPA: S8 family serine peptidase [Mycobacteriales bacterium]|nr:S8 family serine peptidase [Mycobacteriales bacterium]
MIVPPRRLLTAGLVLGVLTVPSAVTAARAAPVRAVIAAPPKAPVRSESNRPASCPGAPTDPNAPDGETRSATGTFPWPSAPRGTDPTAYSAYLHTPAGVVPERPANWDNGGDNWQLTSARSSDPTLYRNPQELCGVEGNSVDTAWQVSTGQPTTVIAITDSGIEWCDPGVVDKIYLNRAALPVPEDPGGRTKAAGGGSAADTDPYDLNSDGVFNVVDYAGDPRIARPYFCADAAHNNGSGYTGISPMDLIRTFGTVGSRWYYGHQGPAGFTEAIAGWNFLDNTNNPDDDVFYRHGTGQAEDAAGPANSLNKVLGACPNCMVLPIRVGDSFITVSDDFAQGVMFAVDSGASVIQEALGTLDITTVTRQAVNYALAHGVPIVASAADEEAEHHNLPGYLPHTIVVNSTTQATSQGGVAVMEPASYLYLNGCTNYGANVDVTVESDSCSSQATGKTGGIVGLVESEAQQLLQAGRLAPYPGLRTVAGAPVALSPNEVAQLVTMNADTIDFQTAAPPFGPPDNNAVVFPYPTVRYPSQPAYDMYTGYGRMDAGKILRATASAQIPPEASIDAPGDWFQTYSPGQSLTVTGLVAAVRARSYRWELEVGVGTSPTPSSWHLLANGAGTARREGVLARVPLAAIAAIFPAGTTFTGGPVGTADRPDRDKFSFTLRLVTVDNRGVVGMDRRTEYLHSDPSLLAGFPVHFGASVDAPPTLAPIGPRGEDALLVATTDGVIHAYLPDGRELPGWPVYTQPLPVHAGEPAYTSGAVTARPDGPIIGGVAVGDLANAAGTAPDVVVSDYTGHVYAWTAGGRLLPGFPVGLDPAYSGPAVRNRANRVLFGIVGAPALADLQGDGRLDIVVGAMDRHVYAWQPDGRPVPGWPVLVIDPTEIASVNPVTNQVTFLASAQNGQGTKIVDTPAIGKLSGSGPPDVVVGSNEEYAGNTNISVASPAFAALAQVPLLSPGNSRVYAIAPTGSDTKPAAGAPGQPAFPGRGAYLPGWPAAIADLDEGLLPDVADGTGGSPVLADLGGNQTLVTGVMTSVGPGYLLTPQGRSYLGEGPDGKALVLDTEPTVPGNSLDFPSLPAVGMPTFAPLGPLDPGVSFIAPAASVGKALDAALPADQLQHDNQIAAWSTTTGHFDPLFPRVVNDLQFIVEPTVADVGGDTTPYIVEGTASYDLRAIDAAGNEAPGFPKFTGGWMVNSPSYGPWGSLRTQVLAAGTREGNLFVWSTPTAACAPSGPWPREHHDLFNTSNLDAPGTPSLTCAPSAAAGATAPTTTGEAQPKTANGTTPLAATGGGTALPGAAVALLTAGLALSRRRRRRGRPGRP